MPTSDVGRLVRTEGFRIFSIEDAGDTEAAGIAILDCS
jgi:hypothetical protein